MLSRSDAIAMVRIIPLALHTSAVIVYSRALYFLLYQSRTIINESYGSHFQYLTVLGLCASLLAQTVSLFSVLTGSRLSVLVAVKKRLNFIAAPAELLISMLYWSLRAVDPQLLIDPKIDALLPQWVDLSIHVYPAFVETVDVLFFTSRYRNSSVSAFTLFLAITALYWKWVHHTFSMNGFFPYPLLELLDQEKRAMLFVGATVILTLNFKALKSVQVVVRKQ